ncbi:hypothetical protein RIF29_26690 [Crotalaria pallida]|uniref:SWIM-type domain-containing protein n=1 Tax=Crotalaria pallida TaxID=3830 RepID=A0AAN9ENY2_CROPI
MRERGRWCRVGGMSLNGEGGSAVNGEDPAASSTNREHGGQSNDPNVGVETINGDAYFFDKLDLGSISAAEVWNLRFVDNEVAFEFYRSEGFRSAVHIGRENRHRSERRLTRCFNDQHNHETVDEESSALFRSHRIMTKEDSAQINCMREAGIPIPKIYAMLACQSGGYPLIGFNKRDMYNDIAQQRLVGEPVLKTQLVELERFGASVYTHEISKMFQVVLKSAESKFVLGWRELRSQVIHLVTRYRKPDSRWLVSYAREEGMMKCSCLRMESTGIPCSHIVKVLVFLHMGELPSYLISKRWTKKAKAHGVRRNQLGASFGDDTLFSRRYGALSDICRYWCNLAARSEEDFMELRQKALIDYQRLEGKQGTEDNDANRTQRQGEQHVNVRDSIRVRTKGRVKNTPSRAPIKRPFKCGFCRGEGHSRNHCPMKDHSQHSSYPGYTQHDLEVPCSMGIDAVMKDQKWN